ncbi:MAG: FAD-dependent monooxygenase [Promethearchaeota archaeon]
MTLETEVAIIGAGPGGMQAAIELSKAGVDTVLIDPSPGMPEAPEGCVTIPCRSEKFGEGPCGTPTGIPAWENQAETPMKSLVMGGPRVIARWDSPKILGYNFTRGRFWALMLDAC